MKKALVHHKLLLASLFLALGAVSFAIKSHNSTPAKQAAKLAPVDILSTIPKPTENSPTDRVVAKWVEQVRAQPSNDKALVNLGDALMQKVRETSDFAYYGYAEKVYQEALASNPNSSDAMTGLAWVNGGKHAFDKSVEWANKAIALDSKNNIAYGIIGDAQLELGEYENALNSYQKMIDIRPDLASYSRGAYALFITGDMRKGRWLMQKAIEAGGPFAENTAWCRSRLATMLMSDGNLLAAEQVLKLGLKSAPNNSHLLMGMGRCKTMTKDYAGAIEFYKKANRTTPDHNAIAAMADLYRITGSSDEATKQEAALEALHSSNQVNGVHDHMQIAQYYADHARNPVEAVRLAEEHKNTKNVFEADTLAWCYYQNGQYKEAQEAINRALSQRTPEAKFLYHAGMISAKLGDTGSAKKYLYQALSLNPQFSLTDTPRAIAAVQELGKTAPRVASNPTTTKGVTR
ncbi:MAG: tetratricopeptide repeat protein [Armatimonadetes bacterium]|nr:tetratricopeptide repeat protein [Armatimonadota bacterium]